MRVLSLLSGNLRTFVTHQTRVRYKEGVRSGGGGAPPPPGPDPLPSRGLRTDQRGVPVAPPPQKLKIFLSSCRFFGIFFCKFCQRVPNGTLGIFGGQGFSAWRFALGQKHWSLGPRHCTGRGGGVSLLGGSDPPSALMSNPEPNCFPHMR